MSSSAEIAHNAVISALTGSGAALARRAFGDAMAKHLGIDAGKSLRHDTRHHQSRHESKATLMPTRSSRAYLAPDVHASPWVDEYPNGD